MKTHKNYLKLKNVNREDTGVFICRGVNGFGSVKVRVDLIVAGKLLILQIISQKSVYIEAGIFINSY